MTNLTDKEEDIRSRYRKYVEDNFDEEVDYQHPSKIVEDSEGNSYRLKFATEPFIGSNYGEGTKILFIGLDIGKDEEDDEDEEDRMQDFEDRNDAIEKRNPENHNPHISGTYITSLSLVKNRYESVSEKVESNKTSFKDAIKSIETPEVNPLSFVALTNVYKYVEVGSDSRRTGREIKVDLAEQYRLLADEIDILEPEIIVLQSKEFEPFVKLSDWEGDVYICPHPSYPGMNPKEYFENLTKIWQFRDS